MYGILQFSRRETISNHGIQFKSIDNKSNCVVNTKIKSHIDRWAKVDPITNELIEILGSVGNFDTESEVLKRNFKVKPCKYPHYRIPYSSLEKYDNSFIHINYKTFTVDSEYTKDIDDALTILNEEGCNIYIGIHITDVAKFIMNLCEDDKKLIYEWISKRTSSAYFNSDSNPMFPPYLAHNILSIVPNEKRPVISLWLEYTLEGELLSSKWLNEFIVSNDKLTYDNFKDKRPDDFNILSKIAKTEDPNDMIAWCMMQYNIEFVKFNKSKNIILRTKPKEDICAKYEFINQNENQIHCNFNTLYTHITSPIRRFVDVYNQMLYNNHTIFYFDIEELNNNINLLSKFHKNHSILELSYKTREEPVSVKVISRNNINIIIEYNRQRYKIPVFDSFYDGDIPDKCDMFQLWGIMKKGRSTLRLCGIQSKINLDNLDNLDNSYEVEESKDNILYSNDIVNYMGYPLDTFQLNCLDVLNDNKDLFCTAPTGSGKTTVAMMGILKAFHSGKRAIFSSPIKALSNEKYSDFYKLLNGRVSLLTGDMKVRCSAPGGDGAPELLIMTAEILRNKLNINNDPDLFNVGVLIVDECHYINDIDRGPVWEETLLELPKHISIVSLSATLSSPEEFTKWLSNRRQTVCVQHHERHVPLYLGSLINKSFKEITNTTNIRKKLGVASDIYTWNKPSVSCDSPVKLVKILIQQNMCPAIVFCMSRKRCFQMAESFTQSLMVSCRPMKTKDMNDIEYDAQVIDWNKEVLSHKTQFYGLVKKYLSTWRKQLGELPQYKGFLELLYKGVAYHHSGMIPILREFVEILFREKLIMAVFATESLGVGINMPARTVVFTQLNKPTGFNFETRNLQTHEFMQMAGRAGRRGKDIKGYVVYYPLPYGKGGISYQEFKHIVLGNPPKAESQLEITSDFVIRNYTKGLEHIKKSLLGYGIDKELSYMYSKSESEEKISKEILRIGELNDKINGKSNFGLFVLNKKQKKLEKTEQDCLLKNLDITLDNALKQYKHYSNIYELTSYIPSQWKTALSLLDKMKFIDNEEITPMGKVASMMSDGFPLVRSIIIMCDDFKRLTFNQIVAWLGIFAWTSNLNESDENITTPIDDVIEYTTYLITEIYNKELLQPYTKVNIIYDWIINKNIVNIVKYTGLEELGNFIKTILRISSFIEELKTILLGLEIYEIYNKFENYEEKLFYGIVSNSSIYV